MYMRVSLQSPLIRTRAGEVDLNLWRKPLMISDCEKTLSFIFFSLNEVNKMEKKNQIKLDWSQMLQA